MRCMMMVMTISVGVRMDVCMFVLMMMPVIMRNRRGSRLFARMNVNPSAIQTVATCRFDVKLNRRNVQPLQRALHLFHFNAQICKRPQNHVTAGAANALEMKNPHGASPNLLMVAAATPAPKPLSMFTTVMPATQEFSIASRALMPPRFIP